MGLLQKASLHYHERMASRLRCKLAACCLLIFFPLCTVFAGGRQQTHDPDDVMAESSYYEAQSEDQTTTLTENSDAKDRPRKIVEALIKAYPDRIGNVEFQDGDWTMEVSGEKFYFAEGRLLPAQLRDKISEYNPHPFYNYDKELPTWQALTEEESARMKEREALRSKSPSKRSTHFYDALWRTRSKEEAWEHAKQIRFLGHPVLVHYSILTKLSLVEEQILRESKTNTTVRQWIDNLKNLESWNWRNIASTQSRSYHAYGGAIDLLPKSLGGLETYWLWTANKIPEWWNVPYARRFHPPDEVIRAFESFGFIWGGKWRYYDTMHFEYRPEILILSGIDMIDPRDLR